MSITFLKERRFFECMLVAVVLGIACISAQMGQHKLIVLNLFFLPIILNAYFMGRSSACILALLSVLAITIVAALDASGLAARFSPLVSGLALAIWAAVLGLAAIMVGTLCDERAKTVDELHEAYVGVVEVLSKYLQGGHPNIKARSISVAELSQFVAEEMRLSRRQIDDIRVAALLYDLGNVEITTNLIAKAVDTLEAKSPDAGRHTFAGTDLVHSLGMVLHGAVPLLLSQQQDLQFGMAIENELVLGQTPIGARIIHVVRAFDQLAGGGEHEPKTTPEHAIRELYNDVTGEYDATVVKALERVVRHSEKTAASQSLVDSKAAMVADRYDC